MADLRDFTQQLQSKLDLSEESCLAAAESLTLPEVPADDKKAFLMALHDKGETVDEVTAFAKLFRQLASDPQLSDIAPRAIDIVGTGGSGSKGFNISSVTAIVVAAAGEKVLKHGNRAITSQSGSADFLTQLGIRMDTDPSQLRAAIEELNFCFFFAPAFHPAFKEIMPVRMQLAKEGKRTIFNILGPLINPAKPLYQLLGVFSSDWVQPLADSLHQLGLLRGLAVSCQLPNGGFMDEITTAGVNHIAGFGGFAEIKTQWKASDLQMPPANPNELKGGTAEENVAMLREIIEGKGPGGLVDSLLLNAAAAFLILDRVEDMREGCALAKEILLGGAVREWLLRAEAFYKATSPEG